jgi:CheY-like chemotaxis protein
VGATAYVIKPLSPHEIKQALRKLMDTGELSLSARA